MLKHRPLTLHFSSEFLCHPEHLSGVITKFPGIHPEGLAAVATSRRLECQWF
jgi:hypothetical protein